MVICKLGILLKVVKSTKITRFADNILLTTLQENEQYETVNDC